MNFKDLTGLEFGRLKVIKRVENSKNGHSKWQCLCKCGKITVVFGSNLKRGHTTSCECLNDEVIEKHGLWGTSTYNTWHGMVGRCTHQKNKRYKYYGGRGITVDPNWLNFKNFLNDMGVRPAKHLTLDRINNDLGYFKANCRWATWEEQRANQRPRTKLEKPGSVPYVYEK